MFQITQSARRHTPPAAKNDTPGRTHTPIAITAQRDVTPAALLPPFRVSQ